VSRSSKARERGTFTHMPARVPDEQRRVPFSVRILPATRERIRQVAEQVGRSESDLGKEWLREGLEREERKLAARNRQVSPKWKKGDA
jgi:predicted DNA-binding protein